MSVRIGVVANPRSRYLKRHPRAIARLRAALAAAGPDRGLLLESPDLGGVPAIAARMRDEGVGVVGIVGGDGTAGIMARAFLDAYGDAPIPPFALLRGGTMNTVANSLGVPRAKPEEGLARLIARTADGAVPPAADRATMDVDGRLGFLFGTGVFHAFLEQYYRAGGDDPSPVTALRTITHAAASVAVQGRFARRIVEPLVATVEVDGEPLGERAYLALAGGTVAEVGLGFEAFHLADRYRRGFHFLALHGSPTSVLRDLGRVWLGLGVRDVNGRNIIATDVTITPRDGRVDYMVDGDLYRKDGPLHVTAGPTIPIVTGA